MPLRRSSIAAVSPATPPPTIATVVSSRVARVVIGRLASARADNVARLLLRRSLQREVTGGLMPRAKRPQPRFFRLALLLRERAPGAEPAPGRGMHGAR